MHHSRILAAAIAVASLTLAGCAGTETDTTLTPETVTETTSATQTQVETVTATETVAKTPVADTPAPGEEAYRAFSAVLDHPNQFPFPPQFQQEINGTYEYAVVDITGDGADEVLLKANTVNIPAPVKVLYWDGSAAQATEDVLLDGPGGEEGLRYTVFSDPYTAGLHQYEATATTLTHQSFALEGGRLVPTSELEETVAGNPLDQENLVAWHSIADRQALANMRG